MIDIYQVKGIMRMLFVLGFLILAMQTLHISYIHWWNPPEVSIEQSKVDQENLDVQKEIAQKELDQLQEATKHRISELLFFWFWGLAFVVCGYLCHQRYSEWLGLPFLLTGFTEMLVYSMPNYFHGECTDSGVLLTYRFYFSLVTFILLLITSWRIGLLERDWDSWEDY